MQNISAVHWMADQIDMLALACRYVEKIEFTWKPLRLGMEVALSLIEVTPPPLTPNGYLSYPYGTARYGQDGAFEGTDKSPASATSQSVHYPSPN